MKAPVKAREMVGACFEMARSERQPVDRRQQLRWAGEKSKVTAAARYLPKGLLDLLLPIVQKDVLPISEELGKPMAYGAETVVYSIGSDRSIVLKLYHGRMSIGEMLEICKANQQLVGKYFGDLAVPLHPFVYESRYHTGQPRLAAMQSRVEGECLFDCTVTPSMDDLKKLHVGNVEMMENEGLVLDFNGGRNVLVDSTGALYIVDTGSLIPASGIDYTGDQRRNMEWLAQIVHGGYVPANPLQTP